MKDPKAFTLVEIFVIAVVLVAFASVLVPKFSSAATEAKISDLCNILFQVRTEIEVYKAQHKDNLPGQGNCSFAHAMTGTTDVNGNLLLENTDKAAVCGPYLDFMPRNPYNDLNTVDVNGIPGDNSHGWYFDIKTQQFVADNCEEHCQL
jgi:type II secretory pathway pseudopilin PulG